jgi:hypothetical protein
MYTIRISLLLIVFNLVIVNIGKAQFSIGIQAGYVMHKNTISDDWALNSKWPAINSGPALPLNFFTDGNGSSLAGIVTWEASQHIDLSLTFQSTHYNNHESQRSSSFNAIGPQVKWNIVKHTMKVIPFIQAGILFSPSSSVHQDAATSTINSTPGNPAVQPAFDQAFSTSLVVGAEIGLEIKLSKFISLLVQGGTHGIRYALGGEDTFTQKLNYGAQVQPPDGLNPVAYYTVTGGLKYYFNKSTKKRDF